MAHKLHIDTSVPKGFEQLIGDTVWGTKTKYIQTDFEERLKVQSDPHFVSIRRNEKLLAVVNLLGRKFETVGVDFESYYIRYFSFFSKYQTSGNSKRKRNSKSDLRNQINELFERGSLRGNTGKTLFYAYVELGNQRSRDICESFHFEPVRRFSTIIFSRFNPKTNPGFSPISKEEINDIKIQLKEFYHDHSMYNSDYLNPQNYFVLREGGKIVAGMQALPTKWIIKDLPGISGKLIMNFAAKIPWVSRIFNPKDYRFLGIDQIFYSPGSESKLSLLLESICHHYDYYSALMWADTESALHDSLLKLPLGPMNKIKKNVPADIIANFANTKQTEEFAFRENPAYINAADVT